MEQQLNTLLLDVASEAISKEKIIGYLDIVKNNPTLSAFNHCMIYLQKPDAQILCRRGAWEKRNRLVKENTKPVVFMYPRITLKSPAEKYIVNGDPQVIAGTNVAINRVQAEYEYNYDAVNVFDISDTIKQSDQTKEDISQVSEISLSDRIFDLTKVTPEYIDNSGNENKYDEKAHILYYSYDLSTSGGQEKYKQMLINFFIENYLSETYGTNDKILKCAIKYILSERYGVKHHIIKAAFGQLDKYSTVDKLKFIFDLQYLINGIIQSLEGYSLTFDETFFIKGLLTDISGVEDAIVKIDNIADSIDDIVIKRELLAFRGKLIVMDERSFFQIIEKCKTGQLNTYPPEEIELKDKNQESILFAAVKKIL